jgi:hypothetical protein
VKKMRAKSFGHSDMPPSHPVYGPKSLTACHTEYAALVVRVF